LEDIPSFSPVIGELKLRAPTLSIRVGKKHENLRLLAFPRRVLERRSRGFRFGLLSLVLLIKGRLAFPNTIKKTSVSNYYNFSRSHVIKEPYIAPEKKGNAKDVPESHAGSSVISSLHHFLINLENRSFIENQFNEAKGMGSLHSGSGETERDDIGGFFTAKTKEEPGKEAPFEEIFNSLFSSPKNENTYFASRSIKNNIHISNRYNGSDFTKVVPPSILQAGPDFKRPTTTPVRTHTNTHETAKETLSSATSAEPESETGLSYKEESFTHERVQTEKTRSEISKDKTGKSATGKILEKAKEPRAKSLSLTQISNSRPGFTKIVQRPRAHEVREHFKVSNLLNKHEFYGGSNNQLSSNFNPVDITFSQELTDKASHERTKDITIEHITRMAQNPGKKTIELKHAYLKKGEPPIEGREIQRSLMRETGQKENAKAHEKNERGTQAQRHTRVNLDNLTDQVYRKLETKIRIERERRGLI
jgi:hypothetical protein